MKYFALIAAAGVGKRFQSEIPKQYAIVHGKTIIEHAVQPFLKHASIEKIVVVISSEDQVWQNLSVAQHPKIFTVFGGNERQDSVLKGLQALQIYAESDTDDWVLVHDAARPCLSISDLQKLIATLADHPLGGLLGGKVSHTLKQVDKSNQIIQTLDRSNMWHAYTPQMFRFGKLLHALEYAQKTQARVTDEASALECLGEHPVIIEGEPSNIKITQPTDLALAEFYLLRSSAY